MHQLILRKQQKLSNISVLSILGSIMRPLSPSIHFSFHIVVFAFERFSLPIRSVVFYLLSLIFVFFKK